MNDLDNDKKWVKRKDSSQNTVGNTVDEGNVIHEETFRTISLKTLNVMLRNQKSSWKVMLTFVVLRKTWFSLNLSFCSEFILISKRVCMLDDSTHLLCPILIFLVFHSISIKSL